MAAFDSAAFSTSAFSSSAFSFPVVSTTGTTPVRGRRVYIREIDEDRPKVKELTPKEIEAELKRRFSDEGIEPLKKAQEAVQKAVKAEVVLDTSSKERERKQAQKRILEAEKTYARAYQLEQERAAYMMQLEVALARIRMNDLDAITILLH